MGKEVGKTVNDARDRINVLKGELEKLKRDNAVNSLVEGR